MYAIIYIIYFIGEENVQVLAMDELTEVFSPELAHTAYLAFLKHVGVNSLDISLKNHDHIRELCKNYEQAVKTEGEAKVKLSNINWGQTISASSSIGSNINVIGMYIWQYIFEFTLSITCLIFFTFHSLGSTLQFQLTM